MDVVIIGLALLVGLLVGSFLNVVIVRLGSGESIWFGRSHCPHCRAKLGVSELVPLLSFALLGGRCRSCKERISLQYPLVEALTAGLFGLFAFHFFATPPLNGIDWQVLVAAGCALAILSGLIVIAVYDIRFYLIPDKVLLPLIVLAVVYQALQGGALLSAVAAALVGALFFFLLFWFSNGAWMGFGDVKFVFFMGIFLGVGGLILALFCAFVSGAIIGVVLMAARRKHLGDHVPFAPFLILGTAVSFCVGAEIIAWYLNLVLG